MEACSRAVVRYWPKTAEEKTPDGDETQNQEGKTDPDTKEATDAEVKTWNWNHPVKMVGEGDAGSQMEDPECTKNRRGPDEDLCSRQLSVASDFAKTSYVLDQGPAVQKKRIVADRAILDDPLDEDETDEEGDDL
ncbi:hypothetical protein AK812_SmicGene21270 [Symbiodinium microadriaticum]|uniref:Uncharacterized protein n=1 Tax=Symbiodinium microadriaticum TaxID=2951 RepID=A0A1Q9DMY4_SYMMI|nr:hypothetical protein AK812_SmicGene21270 [Symbiodinium microadriaticum]